MELIDHPTSPAISPRTLIDEFLDRQRDLTPVERFSRQHDNGELPDQHKYYRDLIPLTKPAAGQQYAFEVDMDACSGCKACVTACHNLNGLDEDETWRSVGLLLGGSIALPVIQHVTTACHHCVEPACMNGCPVLAYEKDPITGIVRHLDDQCIGCQYCILKCPYDVPKYNKRKGIVRKCDMCSNRLSAGEAPACVQSCPNQAIRIRIVEKQKIVEDSEANVFLFGAPSPDYTLPATNYKSSKALPRNTLPADYYQVAPQHSHFPLVIMLVLTQLSVGAFSIGQILSRFVPAEVFTILRPVNAGFALALGMLALAASTSHLGRPFYAFRAVIGLRTSWLSREILTFGLFSQLAATYAVACLLRLPFISTQMLNILGTATAAVGILGVFCSVMIYHDTRRAFWRFKFTATKFFLSTALLGVATVLVAALIAAGWSKQLQLQQLVRGWGKSACEIMALISAIKIVFGLMTYRYLRDRQNTPMKRTARLLAGPLLQVAIARLALGIIGGILLPLICAASFSASTTNPSDLAVLLAASFAMTLASELIERYLFFTAVVAPKMPGGLAG